MEAGIADHVWSVEDLEPVTKPSPDLERPLLRLARFSSTWLFGSQDVRPQILADHSSMSALAICRHSELLRRRVGRAKSGCARRELAQISCRFDATCQNWCGFCFVRDCHCGWERKRNPAREGAKYWRVWPYFSLDVTRQLGRSTGRGYAVTRSIVVHIHSNISHCRG